MHKCRNCKSVENFIEILNLGPMPLAGGFLDKSDIPNEKLYELKVHSCKICGLVQILDAITPEILFENYSFTSSTVIPLVTHFENLAKEISSRINSKSKILEIGCNDGILLAPLNKMGFQTIGVDISKNITQVARSKGLNVYTGMFNLEWINQNYQFENYFDLISCSNSFPHNADPDNLLKAMYNALTKDGEIVLEIMYAGKLLEDTQWDTLYHEHLTFYSLTTLKSLLETHGFFVYDAEIIPMHGGSIRVWASKIERPGTHRMNTIVQTEQISNLNSVESWINFGKASIRSIDIVQDILGRLSKEKKIGAYGAAGKATMWLNACKLDFVEFVVDASPLRYGKFMPGVHSPIISPDEFKKNYPDLVLVTAWNYLEQIKKNETNYGGIWCSPLPTLNFS